MLANACRLLVLTSLPALASAQTLHVLPSAQFNGGAAIIGVSNTGRLGGSLRPLNTTSVHLATWAPGESPLFSPRPASAFAFDPSTAAVAGRLSSNTEFWNGQSQTTLPAFPERPTIIGSVFPRVVDGSTGAVWGTFQDLDSPSSPIRFRQIPWQWSAASSYQYLPTPSPFSQGIIRCADTSRSRIGGTLASPQGLTSAPAMWTNTPTGWVGAALAPPTGTTYADATDNAVIAISANGSAIIGNVLTLQADGSTQASFTRWENGRVVQQLPALTASTFLGDAAFIADNGSHTLLVRNISTPTVWFADGSTIPAITYLTNAGVVFPTDATVRIAAMSPDGLTFAGTLTSPATGLTNNPFVATIPSPATLPLVSLSLLAARRRRP
jgi:hypothetical protein